MMKKFKFNRVFVINVTIKHMIRAIDISLDKTAKRIEEIEPDEVKEMLECVSELFALRKSLEKYSERYNQNETSSR